MMNSFATPPHDRSMSTFRFDLQVGWRMDADGFLRKHPKGYPEDSLDAILLGAATEGDSAMLQKLALQPNVDWDFQGPAGWTPLIAAARYGHGEVVIELLAQRADCGIADNLGQTAFILAAMFDHAHIIELIADPATGQLADVEHEDLFGRTALSWAAKSSSVNAVHQLCEIGADIFQAPDHLGFTPLSLAAQSANSATIGALLYWGADIEHSGTDGLTPLMLAAEAGNLPAAAKLLELGADKNAMDDDKLTALRYAIDGKHQTMALFLIEHGCDSEILDIYGSTALFDAIQHGLCDVVTVLLQRGAEANAKRGGKMPCLAWAASHGHLDVAGVLLAHGARIETKCGDNEERCTALGMAAARGRLAIVERLLDLGADVDAVDQRGLTPLMDAAHAGHEKIVRLLIERGADVGKVDHKGRDAWTIAFEQCGEVPGAWRVEKLLRGILSRQAL